MNGGLDVPPEIVKVHEPKWRECLNWGAVITFFIMPLSIFLLHLISLQVKWLDMEKHIGDFRYLRGFYDTNALLVFGLAGLNTVDKLNVLRRKENGSKP